MIIENSGVDYFLFSAGLGTRRPGGSLETVGLSSFRGRRLGVLSYSARTASFRDSSLSYSQLKITGVTISICKGELRRHPDNFILKFLEICRKKLVEQQWEESCHSRKSMFATANGGSSGQ